MNSESNNFEDYESEDVKMKPPCSCGNQIFRMEVRYSDKPAYPGFNRMLDRKFICVQCRKAFVLEETYPVSSSFV